MTRDELNIPRAAILARCSSEANVCNQVLLLKQFANGKYQVDEDDIYSDNISGSSSFEERSELQRLLHNIEQKKKKYAIVLAQDTSRLGKNDEQLQQIVGWFQERDIRLQFLSPE